MDRLLYIIGVFKYIQLFTPVFIIFILSINTCNGITKLNVCVTKECYNAAEDLKASINPDVDPCDDFYEFACGGWRKNHPIPLTEQAWNPFAVATNQITQTLKELLENRDGSEFADPAPVQSAKLFYDVCMNNEQIELQGLKPIIDLTDKFGGWPLLNRFWKFEDFNWQDMFAELAHRLYFQPIIHVDVGTDFKNSSQHIIYVDQPSLVVLRQMLVSPELYKIQISAYKLFVKQVAELFTSYLNKKFLPNVKFDEKNDKNDIIDKSINHIGIEDNDIDNNIDYETISRISEEVEDMIQFEIDIAKIMSSPEMRRDFERLYNKMTIRELQSWTDSASAGSVNSQSSIDWLKLIRMVLKNTNCTIDYSEKIIVREMNYLFNLVKLLQRTPLKTIANYLHWRLIEEFSNELTADIRKLHFQFRRIFTGASEEYPRWKECVKSTQFVYGLALGYKYTQLYFDEKSKKSAMEMVDNLISTFYDQMANVTWMDDKTKQAAKEKITSMTRFIGYPDWFTDNITHLDSYYSGLNIGADHFSNVMKAKIHHNNRNWLKLPIPVDRKEWPPHEPPVTVNAFYSPFMNAIIFPAAVLQPPFFNKGRPDALNYGGVGVIIGHEITHGFDDIGRQYDKYGNLAQWWSEHTVTEHFNKTKCFIQQYGNFDVPELNEILFQSVKLNGLLTVGENMADNGGLRQAYLAYKRNSITVSNNGKYFDNVNDGFGFYNAGRLTSYKATDIRLPGLEMFSNDQLFFLGFASNWCESQTRESLLHEVLGNVHSPQKYRVLGSVANSPEFSKVFNCPVGSPMNPEGKCSFW